MAINIVSSDTNTINIIKECASTNINYYTVLQEMQEHRPRNITTVILAAIFLSENIVQEYTSYSTAKDIFKQSLNYYNIIYYILHIIIIICIIINMY